MDNPKELPLTGKGTKVRISTLQSDEFMTLAGEGGMIDELGVEQPSMKEFIREILFDPQLNQKPEHLRNKVLSSLLRKRQNAYAALVISRHDDLKEMVEVQLKRKAEMDAGTLSPTQPINLQYLKELFNYSLEQELLL